MASVLHRHGNDFMPMRYLSWMGGIVMIFISSACHRASIIENDSQSQVVVAKIIVQPNKKTVSNLHNRSLEDFYDHQVSLLESVELKGLAEKKVSSANQDGNTLKLQVARIKGSSVLNIIARSASPTYAKAYLESLLEEYILKVQGTRDDTAQGKLPNPDEQVQIDAAYQKVQAAEKNLAMFKLENESFNLETERSIAQRRVKRLDTALAFYRAELEQMSKLGLENDIRRRVSPSAPPTEMPEEFARMVSVGLTPNEQAYLDALSKTDERTKTVTKTLAEMDMKARADSYNHQADAVLELANDLNKRLGEIERKLKEAGRLEGELAQTRGIYDGLKTPPTNKEPSSKDTEVEGVIVSVMESPTLLLNGK